VANTEKTAVPIPVVVVPIEVELTLAVVVPQFRDITVRVDIGNRVPCISSRLLHQYLKFLENTLLPV